VGYKITCCTDGRYLNLLYIDPANKHDLTIIRRIVRTSVKGLEDALSSSIRATSIGSLKKL